MQYVVLLVFINAETIALRPRPQHLGRPDTGIENGVGMKGVDPDAVTPPLQRGDAHQLVDGSLGHGVRRGPGTRGGYILGADDHDASALWGQL